MSGRDAETIQNDALNIVEIDADERIAGNVVFDLNDFDAAIAELDARYLAGKAAARTGGPNVAKLVLSMLRGEHDERSNGAHSFHSGPAPAPIPEPVLPSTWRFEITGYGWGRA